MNIILTKDVENLGNAGDILKVKDGYARNYLVPSGLALVASSGNAKTLEFQKKKINQQIDLEYNAARALAETIAANDIRIVKKAGEEGKLFGSVTNREIYELLEAKNIVIDHRKIVIDVPIKKVGVYDVEIKLFREVKGALKVWVVAEEEAEA